jgi:hypothetical protein
LLTDTGTGPRCNDLSNFGGWVNLLRPRLHPDHNTVIGSPYVRKSVRARSDSRGSSPMPRLSVTPRDHDRVSSSALPRPPRGRGVPHEHGISARTAERTPSCRLQACSQRSAASPCRPTDQGKRRYHARASTFLVNTVLYLFLYTLYTVGIRRRYLRPYRVPRVRPTVPPR